MTLRKRLSRFPLLQMTYRCVRGWTKALLGSFRYLAALAAYRSRRGPDERFAFRWSELYPCLGDDTATTGFDRHYTFHTAWAARLLAQTRPAVHHDISSAIYFSTIVSAFLPVRFYDYRPARLPLSNLTSEAADLLNLPFATGSIASLSCMHVVEHVGLGRYGDPIDPEGSVKAIRELQRVVRPGGQLLFVVPLGAAARVQFNAHRIFDLALVKSLFAEGFELKQFALIPDRADDGDLLVDPSPDLLSRQAYGCGCFWFTKRGEKTS